MKKQLLLTSFALVASFALKAQDQLKKFDETREVTKPNKIERNLIERSSSSERSPKQVVDKSYFYWENHDRVTAELKKFLGKDKSLDGLDTSMLSGFYSYSVKEKTATSGKYKQECYQAYDVTNNVKVDSIFAFGKALNSAGSKILVSLYYDKITNAPTSVDTVTVSSTFGSIKIGFKKAIENNGKPFYLGFKSVSVKDSFQLAYINSWFNGWISKKGTNNDTLRFNSALPFSGDAAIFAKDVVKDTILGMAASGFDFLTVPKFTYTFAADFAISNDTVIKGDSVGFFNKTNAAFNPILNGGAYMALVDKDPQAINAEYIFGKGDTLATFNDSIYKKYSTIGTYNVSAAAVVFPWYSTANYFADTINFKIVVREIGVGINENAISKTSIYPNPTSSLLNVNFNTTSAATVELINVVGQVLELRNVASGAASTSFDMVNLNAGIYFVRIKSENGQSTYKVVRN